MIAKKKWFDRRKYGGWGLVPKTREGVLYIIAVIASLLVFEIIVTNDLLRVVGLVAWVLFLLLDTAPVMFDAADDERESKIEALSERNASWGMMFILVMGVIVEIVRSSREEVLKVNVFLVAALIVGVLVKSFSNYYYGKREL